MVSINRLVLALVVVAMASAVLLAELNGITAPKIKASQTAYKLKAVKKVLPPYDNQPAAEPPWSPARRSTTRAAYRWRA